MFRGSIVAIVTPFDSEGRFDEEAFRQLVEFQIENGTDGIVPCGSTGEAATLDHQGHMEVIRACVEQVNKRVPILAGTGSNSTSEAIELTKAAKEAGADGALLITPYYNKPSQEGLYQHFKTVAEQVAIPQMLYNVPGRTGINLTVETTVRLAEISNVIGLKDASGGVNQAGEILACTGEDFAILSGDDSLTLPFMSVGAKGVISVTANIMPAAVKALVAAIEEGRWEDARQQHFKLLDIHNIMFIESNPTPAKAALELMGRCKAGVRLPLVTMQPQSIEQLKTVMARHGLIA
ncbi:4-hydroxy-tetrahydrodipicolinate synthase [Syntrophotalea acetylenivorans]|uniref:4-hydroxy-tetrahydrodipicolinate synthase n=1 Tax=Syntrophotalea acetylenivorans TaxID=1842532 RepID=A0A1L3GS97_9BACT|nr:4-hydroxy-tetrahydrodipicolinate synthase [Syntrophotalea acetylenivorans]APG28799.1 4-hydroxy-tetrahydrodipicolinate synthase [Syntrophotalea acetylenivorans]